jgi:hypothetical protein
MNNNIYLIFPIKSIKFFKNVITSKNEILCAEAGSFAAEGREYFWSSFTVFMQIRLGTLRYYLLLWSLRQNTTGQTNNACLAGGPGLF